MANENELVKLFMIDGTFNGILTAGIANWSGHVFSAPLSKFEEFKQFEELRRSGVYILIGDEHAYIGESDEILKRWVTDKKHEIWDGINNGKYNKVIVATSTDGSITTKGHIKYLESLLINLANNASGEYKIKELVNNQKKNAVTPLAKNLPREESSFVEKFLDKLKIIFPVIGVDIFKQTTTKKPTIATTNAAKQGEVQSPVFELIGKEYSAEAQVIDDEFTVLAGSKCVKEWHSEKQAYRYQSRQKMIENGDLTDNGTHYIFADNHAVSSPSFAACIVCGTETRNGSVEWIVKDGQNKSYGQWLTEKVGKGNA
jgi:hypothetical protein